MPKGHGLSGGIKPTVTQSSGVMSNQTRLALVVLARMAVQQSRPTTTTPSLGYDVAILILNCVLVLLAENRSVRPRKAPTSQ